MKRFALTGVTALSQPARISADVTKFTGHNDYFTVADKGFGNIELSTPKGSYLLKKHTNQNYYHGTCAGRKVHIILKKIVGEVLFW